MMPNGRERRRAEQSDDAEASEYSFYNIAQAW